MRCARSDDVNRRICSDFGSESSAAVRIHARSADSALAEFVDRLGLTRFALVVHDFGGPIGLPLCLDGSHDVTALVVLNTWMWPLDNDPQIVKAAD